MRGKKGGCVAMFRVGSLLMALFLAAPVVRACCLPVTPTPPCHEPAPKDHASCAATERAIAETKAIISVTAHPDWELPALHSLKAAVNTTHVLVADHATLFLSPPSDVYLRNGVLLI
jgi:hypothetical protein